MQHSKRTLFALAVMAVCQARSTPDDEADYPVMAEAMRQVGGDFTWQSYQVITDDDYILTLFRITADEQGAVDADAGHKGPLLLQHGFVTDSITWFQRSDEQELAIGSQLFQEGYDVWFGNIRGSRNSRRHLRYDPDEDAEDFWDFSFPEFGRYDLPAMLTLIKHNTQDSCKKITYVGHSQGTIMAFYGLAHASHAEKYLAQAIMVAPCFLGSFDDFKADFDEGEYRILASALAIFGIESVFGPRWSDQLNLVCTLLGPDSDECQALSNIPLGPVNGGSNDGFQEVGVKQSLHMAQNFLEGRFQEFANYFIFGGWFQRKQLVPLENISGVPIRYMYMGQDSICDVDETRQLASRIPMNDGEVTLDRDHGAGSGSNDAEFMAALRSLLLNSGEEMDHYHCVDPFCW